MSVTDQPSVGQRLISRSKRLCRFGRDDRGATAVEFALVITPFLMFVCALMGSTIFFFVSNSLEKGMDETSRLVRTGQAITSKMTLAQFKKSICDGAGGWIDCTKLQVWAQSWPDWSALNPDDPTGQNPHACVDTNNTVEVNTSDAGKPIATYSGGASDVVIVTTCYQWDFAAKVPFLRLGNMQNGTMMIQNSTAFRTEPYPAAGS